MPERRRQASTIASTVGVSPRRNRRGASTRPVRTTGARLTPEGRERRSLPLSLSGEVRIVDAVYASIGVDARVSTLPRAQGRAARAYLSMGPRGTLAHLPSSRRAA